MVEWININDRLPEECDWVLISAVDYKNPKLRFVPHVAKLRNGKWVSQENDNRDIENWFYVKVTHWMPLPDSPRC